MNSILCSVVLALLASNAAFGRPQTVVASAASSGNAYGALSGAAAAHYRVPSDVRLVRTWRDAKHDLTYSRYQQYVQPHNAAVDGAQMTVVKRGQAVVLVIGAHFPNLRVTNTLKVTGPQAAVRATANKTLRDATSAETRANLKHRTELWLNPADGRLFHRVESGGAGVYVISQIDAETGAIIDSWNALPNVDPGEGTGVRNDLKDLGLNGPDLTFQESPGGLWRMQTANGRIRTLNAANASPNGNMNPNWTVLGDNDNAWEGPLQRAAVDAQYYTALTDGWYMDAANVGVFDLVSDCATSGYADLRSAVHIGNSYSNAFFDPSTGMFGYGDGDGFQFRAFSGGQDIVSHEVTHRVTECRAPLEYKYQPGALNEAISDIMATTMEWEINEPTSTNCRRQVGQGACPDWWVGEDIVLAGDFGFRNLADPETAGNPSHWDDRVCKNEGFCSDGGGVHSNSLIPGHAFYLMVNGGRNARCSGPTDPQADCDVVVPQIPMDDAAELMFAAWGLLPNPTTNPAIKQQMCNAHAATVYQAALLFPGSALHIAAADLAWTAVGRGYGPDTGIDGDCQPPNDFQNTDPPGPEPPNFAPQMPVRSIVLGQGGSGSLSVAPSDETHTFAATGGGSATLTFNAPHTQLGISVPPDMPGGVYPLLVSESDGPTNIAYVGAALIIDSDPPTVSVNSVSLAATGQIGASGAGTVPLLVDWSANDDGTGIDGSALEKSSTGSFPGTTVATGGAGGSSTVTTVDATDYFLVRATDNAGNDGISSVSGPWNIGRFQEGSAIYKKTWTTAALANSWQGSVRFATAYGASARFIFTGTDVAWITTKASNRGKVKVYLDGLFKRKINLAAGTLGSRLVAYRLTGLSAGSHTLRIKIVTSGKRVDVDGYVTLNH